MEKEKEAYYYKKVSKKIVQCQLCPNNCVIQDGKRGKCGVRENKNGRLITLVYSKPCSLAIDPIEKKPLYHFFPGSKTLSIATPGCNLKCKHCQNWEISQVKPEEISSLYVSPKDVVKEAIKRKIKIISYTYTEPTIFYEYMTEIARIAKKHKIKNVIVTNGFINEKPLKELCEYIDAANIDIKSMDEDFYKNVCDARLKPILEAVKILQKNNVWIEITNLIIPGLNDSEENIKKLVLWIKGNLGNKVPLHFSAFYPCNKMLSLERTRESTVKMAREIALKLGLKFVYTGNIGNEDSTTYCLECNNPLITRKFYSILKNNIKIGKCQKCKTRIPGIWK